MPVYHKEHQKLVELLEEAARTLDKDDNEHELPVYQKDHQKLVEVLEEVARTLDKDDDEHEH